MKAFFYILSASSDPDRVNCAVPWRIDTYTIYFGPCKKKLRRWMKKHVLGARKEVVPSEVLFVVGFNGANHQKVRKIVWAGHVIRVMTFERAFHTLAEHKYNRMRMHRYSPLHLQPIDVEGRFGYRHISYEHIEDDAWIWDVVDRSQSKNIERRGNQILLLPGAERQEVLALDCCFLCENIFFARGKGIPVTGEILNVLGDEQSGKMIDKYAIFGRQKNGRANGLRGNYLKMDDKVQIQRLMKAIKIQAETLQREGVDSENEVLISCLRGCND